VRSFFPSLFQTSRRIDAHRYISLGPTLFTGVLIKMCPDKARAVGKNFLDSFYCGNIDIKVMDYKKVRSPFLS